MPKEDNAGESAGGGERLFLESIDLFQAVAISQARRYGLSPEDAEDFRQQLLALLYQNDCEALRNFKGRSSLKTYINGIAANLIIDFMAERSGRWRPSTMARSLGPVAVELERLIVFEGLQAEVAITSLSTRYKGSVDVGRLRGITELLPSRTVRRYEGEESLATMRARRGDPHAELESHEGAVRLHARLEELLPRALETLGDEELLLLKLTLLEENRVSELARSWGRDDQELYRLRAKALKKLRNYLVDHGIRPDDIRWLLSGGES